MSTPATRSVSPLRSLQSVDGFDTSAIPEGPRLFTLLQALPDQDYIQPRNFESSRSSTPLVAPTPHGFEWWRSTALEKKAELKVTYSVDIVEQVRRKIHDTWYWKMEALAYWEEAKHRLKQKPSRRAKSMMPWKIRQKIDNSSYWEIEFEHYRMKTAFVLRELGLLEKTSRKEYRVSSTDDRARRKVGTKKKLKKKQQDRISKNTSVSQQPRRSSRIAAAARSKN